MSLQRDAADALDNAPGDGWRMVGLLVHIEGDVVLLGEVPEAGVGEVECHVEEQDSPLVDLGDLLLDCLVLLGIQGADLQAIVTEEADGDRRAQDGFTFVSLMVERFLVVSFPGLPVSGTAANIGLHLLHPYMGTAWSKKSWLELSMEKCLLMPGRCS